MTFKPDSISYRLAEPKDTENILRFLDEHFLGAESTSVALGIDGQQQRLFNQVAIRNSLKYPVSFLAENSQKELIGVRLSSFKDFTEIPSPEKDAETESMFTHPNMKILDKYLCELEGDNVADRFPEDVKKLIKFEMVATDLKRYARRGVASNMIKRSLEAAKTLGAQGVYVSATALASQKMFERMGFETLVTVKHSDFVDDQGNPYLKCLDGTDRGLLMWKRI